MNKSELLESIRKHGPMTDEAISFLLDTPIDQAKSELSSFVSNGDLVHDHGKYDLSQQVKDSFGFIPKVIEIGGKDESKVLDKEVENTNKEVQVLSSESKDWSNERPNNLLANNMESRSFNEQYIHDGISGEKLGDNLNDLPKAIEEQTGEQEAIPEVKRKNKITDDDIRRNKKGIKKSSRSTGLFERLFFIVSTIGISIVDVFSLLVASGVDFIFSLVFYQFIAVDSITRIGFSAIVFLIVYFKVKSLSEMAKKKLGYLVLYLPLTFTTLFGGVSFTIIDLEYQATKGDMSNDKEFVRLNGELLRKQDNEKDASQQYKAATKRETMDQLYNIWQQAITDRKGQELAIAIYKEIPHIEAKKTFTAISEALTRQEYVEVLTIFVLFVSIEACVVAAVIFMRKKESPVSTK